MDLSVYLLFGMLVANELELSGILNPNESSDDAMSVKKLIQGTILPFFSSHQEEFLRELSSEQDPYRRVDPWLYYGFEAYAYIDSSSWIYPRADDIDEQFALWREVCSCIGLPHQLPYTSIKYLDTRREKDWYKFLKESVDTCPHQFPCSKEDLKQLLSSIQVLAKAFVLVTTPSSNIE